RCFAWCGGGHLRHRRRRLICTRFLMTPGRRSPRSWNGQRSTRGSKGGTDPEPGRAWHVLLSLVASRPAAVQSVAGFFVPNPERFPVVACAGGGGAAERGPGRGG